jgi:outer membrane lipoprotein LolB
MVQRLARFAFLITLGIMSGCTVPAPRTPATIPPDLHDLDRWQARGRLGVSSGEGGGSGSFVWQQRDDFADVQIRGPVGIGSVRLQVRGSDANPNVRLETSNGQVLESAAAWDELEARLGAPGLAAPGDHRWSEPTPEGETTLEQDGWRIDYQRFSTDPGARVPVRIRAASGDTRVRIVIDQWQLGS